MSHKKVSIYVSFILLFITAIACGGGEAVGDDVDPYAESDAAVEESQEVEAEEAAAVDAEWVEFVSEAGNFTARFPVEPTEEVRPAPNTDIETDVHMFVVEVGPTAYMVSYNDYPVALTNGTERTPLMESAFDGAREAMMGSVSGTLVAEADISLAGYPGRQLEFDIAESLIPGGGAGTLQMYAVGERFYQLLIIGPEGQPSAEEIDAFMASFDLLEAPAVGETGESDIPETSELADQ